MDILKTINDLKKSIFETDKLVDDLILSLKNKEIETQNKEKKILFLKEEIKNNVDKIDELIEKYNANN